MTAAERALRNARAHIGVAVTRTRTPDGTRIGAIVLRPAQATAAALLHRHIARHRGAMLADRVGLGKTYTALAVARAFRDVVIVCPSSLRLMWEAALDRTDSTAVLVTMESLSRSGAPALRPGLVIVDEAHRARSPQTRRYAALARLCMRCPVLLLTATPIQNARDDLAAQLALFLGHRAFGMTGAELAEHVMRRREDDARMPRIDGPHPMRLARQDDWLDELLALPAPVPATDEGAAAALWTFGLLHQWASSRAALVASLRRRLAKTVGIRDLIDAGRAPSRADLTAWCEIDGAVQLALPGLLGGATAEGPVLDDFRRRAALLQAGLERLLRVIPEQPDPDVARAALLLHIQRRHPGARIIAFSQYVETVRRLGRLLVGAPRVAQLTARGARIASGPVPRTFVLRQFAPGPPSRADSVDRIELLLATDVLSEGLNLQQASVVVHLDLPWNPARLEQRVGRAARMGSDHDAVTVYVVEPPASVERVLAIQDRLRRKLGAAAATVGAGMPVLPLLLMGDKHSHDIGAGTPESDGGLESGAVHCRSAPTDPDTAGSAEVLTALHRRLVQWAQCRLPDERAWPSPVVAAAHAPTTGYLAAVHLGGAVQLVANLGAGLRTTPDVLARAAAFAEGPATEPAAAETVVHEIREWLWAQRGRRAVDLTRDPRLLRSVLRRIENVAASAPRHRRMDVVRLAHRARGVVTGPLTAGAERALAGLEYSHLDDAEWLRAVAAVAVEHTEGATGADAVLAVIMFVPEPPGSPAIRTTKLAPPATGGTRRVRARFLAPRLSRTSVPCACNDSRRPYW